jgi:hypothetical protein
VETPRLNFLWHNDCSLDDGLQKSGSGGFMEYLFDLGSVTLTIPAWQMAMYLAIIAFYMICGRVKICLLTTFGFALYWGYYLFSGDFLVAVSGKPSAESAYFGFGLALIAFNLIALFYEER